MVEITALVDDLLQAASDLTLYEDSLQGVTAMQITSLAMRSTRFKTTVARPAPRESLPASVAGCIDEAYSASRSWDVSEMSEDVVQFLADLELMAARLNAGHSDD